MFNFRRNGWQNKVLIYAEETGVNSEKSTSNCSFLGIYLVVSEKVCTFAKVEKKIY